jgi:hypothetical protein
MEKSKNTNLIIIPSRNRVDNVERVVRGIKETSSISDIMIGLDHDNHEVYPRIKEVIYEVNPQTANRMNGALNLLSTRYANLYETITFMGDDHLPKTKNWDEILYQPIKEKGYGVSYGNDLYQGENLPTAVVMSTKIIKCLGFMSPPDQIHMFLDNFWKEVGTRLDALFYFDDVVIEHLHAYVGKSELDEMYLSVNNPDVAGYDGEKYGEYIYNKFDLDVKKLKSYLGIE